MTKDFFVCKICGDIHFGVNAPEICPTCEQKNAYEKISKEKAKTLMKL